LERLHQTDRAKRSRILEHRDKRNRPSNQDRFQLLPASDEVHIKWRSLPVKHEVKGVQVHDARLAATMYVHKILRILTNNTRDFKRYSGLETITPQEVIAGVV